MKSILDPSFEYTPSAQTDVRKTFARIWREMQNNGKAELYSLPGRDAGYGRRSVSLAFLPVEGALIRESAPGVELLTYLPDRL